MAEVLSNLSTYIGILDRRAPSQIPSKYTWCMKALAIFQEPRSRSTDYETVEEGGSLRGSPILLELEGAIVRKLQVSRKSEG